MSVSSLKLASGSLLSSFTGPSSDASIKRSTVRDKRVIPPVPAVSILRSSCQAGAACQLSDKYADWFESFGNPSAQSKQTVVRSSFLPSVHGKLSESAKGTFLDRRPDSMHVRSLAMEAMEEALTSGDLRGGSDLLRRNSYWKSGSSITSTSSYDGNYRDISAFQGDLLPALPVDQTVQFPPKNRADMPSLHNPLQRQHRMGCGWLGVAFEWDGVIVEDQSEMENKAWIALAEEEAKPIPMAFVLKRAQGMKAEQAIGEVFCWSRDPRATRRLAERKEELYETIRGGMDWIRAGAKEFVLTLKHQGIPIAVMSTRPRKFVEKSIKAVGLDGVFDVVLSAEDVHRGKPDPEMFQYAAERLGFIPDRCIVVGNSNKTVEGAHDALMKCVAVAGVHRAFELGAADLVVRRLDELTIVDLKNLATVDSPEFEPPEEQVEEEEEEQVVLPKMGLAFMDDE